MQVYIAQTFEEDGQIEPTHTGAGKTVSEALERLRTACILSGWDEESWTELVETPEESSSVLVQYEVQLIL